MEPGIDCSLALHPDIRQETGDFLSSTHGLVWTEQPIRKHHLAELYSHSKLHSFEKQQADSFFIQTPWATAATHFSFSRYRKYTLAENLFGLQIIGEGTIQGKHLYLPAIKSILKFDTMTGDLVDTISTNIQAYKIRYAHDSWQMINRKNAFVFANEGEFPQNLKPALKPVNVKPQAQVIASRQKRYSRSCN